MLNIQLIGATFSNHILLIISMDKDGVFQEGYIEELTRFSQCLNAKTGFINF